jgi:hypothetical protein
MSYRIFGRYEVHLDQKLERNLAMLRFKDMSQWSVEDPSVLQSGRSRRILV